MRKCKTFLTAAAVIGLTAIVCRDADAAPISSTVADLNASATETSAAQSVAYRCWWDFGVRYCRWVPPVLGYYYAPPVFGFGFTFGSHRHGRRW